jgi:glucosamine-6-phosphate deaminase
MTDDVALPEVRVLHAADLAVPIVLGELQACLERQRRPLVSFATGGTFAGFLLALADELRSGRASRDFLATHLDEYLGYEPARRGGMVHELGVLCPPLLDWLARGAFLPVPHVADPAELEEHGERLRRAGGVALQLLGIGRNGHIAFNEPGTAFDLGFHVTALAASTRADARARFAPDEPPFAALTAGAADILAARRIVLCAFGAGKAEAVRAMLTGAVTEACPASVLRRHGNTLVLLDPAAAALLPRAGDRVVSDP